MYWAHAPVPHWHYVTYGFSELYAKESSDAATSGYGFELTFRLAAEAAENADSTPPVWPMNLLQNRRVMCSPAATCSRMATI